MNQNKDTIVKPSILSGFLELLPEDQIIFNNMLDTIRVLSRATVLYP